MVFLHYILCLFTFSSCTFYQFSMHFLPFQLFNLHLQFSSLLVHVIFFRFNLFSLFVISWYFIITFHVYLHFLPVHFINLHCILFLFNLSSFTVFALLLLHISLVLNSIHFSSIVISVFTFQFVSIYISYQCPLFQIHYQFIFFYHLQVKYLFSFRQLK